ncbi:MAG: hypothetical protein R3D80_04645 [Paracoccaceae bacterium]
MNRALAGFDAWAETAGLADLPAPERFEPTGFRPRRASGSTCARAVSSP